MSLVLLVLALCCVCVCVFFKPKFLKILVSCFSAYIFEIGITIISSVFFNWDFWVKISKSMKFSLTFIPSLIPALC